MGKKGLKKGGLKLEFAKGNDQAGRSPKKQEAGGSSNAPLSSASTSSRSSKVDLFELDPDGDLDLLMKKACDLETLKITIVEWERVMALRENLRKKNERPNYEEFEALRDSRKLDANLKKCTSFVKKIKNFTGLQLDQIEKEFQSLNLTKFLSEIAAGLSEARIKFGDIHSTVLLISKFHQRYSEFSEVITDVYKKNLIPRKADFNPSLVSKLTVDIRLFGELVMCGLIDKIEGFDVIITSLKNVIMFDKDEIQYSTPLISFCRGLGFDLAGLVTKHIKELSEKFSIPLPESTFIPAEKKETMKSLLLEYYDHTCRVMRNAHEDLLASEMRNRKFLKTKGEIPDDRIVAHSELSAIFDRHLQTVKKFANYLDTNIPELRELPKDLEVEKANQLLDALNFEPTDSTSALASSLRIYDDEETRSFYQDLPDMKVYLPQIVYRDNILKTAEETAAIAQREKELVNVDEELEVALLNLNLEDKEGEQAGEEEPTDDPADALPPSEQLGDEKTEEVEVIRPVFQNYLAGLLNCVNTRMIDKAARDFVDNFNNRPNRKKLILTLFKVPRNRLDLLPLWSRLVAILAPVMPELKLDLCSILFNDFRYLVRKKDQIFIETKLKITRFIGELVNFGLFPKSDAFQCFKSLLMNFVHHQIEMACAFLETCGRYLHRSPDSHRRMQIYLEEFKRRKAQKSLEPRYADMVEYAYYYVCPPETGHTRKKREPIHAFLRHMIYDNLQRNNLDKTLKIMRSLNWNDPKHVNYFVGVMSKPWHLKFNQYATCASLLAALVPFQSYAVTRVVDNVIETIYGTVCCTSTQANLRRVALTIFLGEFYSYKLLGSTEIFAILYALISRGVVLDHNYYNPYDPPHNLFRIRLVCTLLKTCGQYFCHGNGKKKLNCYLKYLERYYWFKKSHPMWTERNRFSFVITELMEETVEHVRPSWNRAPNYEEACKVVNDLENKLRAVYFPEAAAAYEAQQLAALEQGASEAFNPYPAMPSDTVRSGSVMSNKDEGSTNWEEEEITDENWHKFLPTEAEIAEFDQQIEILSHDTGGVRQARTDIPVPLKTSPVHGHGHTREPGTVDFVLLTKKGNKQTLKHIAIDENKDFVKRITASKKAEEEERKKLKELTLGINRRQQEEEEREMYQIMFK